MLHFGIGSECLSQLVADAGNDTAVCEDIATLTIGGNPTANGGVPPYSYTWSGTYKLSSLVFTASFMLEDTTVANPIFKERAIPDSVVFYVSVRDANDSVAMDSIVVRQSVFGACLGECRHYISLGDSVQLGHCVFGGIPPFQFTWEPSAGLSDSTIENPWAKPNLTTYYTLLITDSIGCQTSAFCRVYINPSSKQEEFKRPDISIYPNPATNNIKISFNRSNYLNTNFELISSAGRTVYRVQVWDSSIMINAQDYSSGAYLFKWLSDNDILETGIIIIE